MVRSRQSRAWLAALLSLAATSAFANEHAPYASTYVPRAAEPFTIVNATVMTGTLAPSTIGAVRVERGRIQQVDPATAPLPGDTVLDAAGLWLTPGIIDVHSHLGDYPAPTLASTQDGNELSAPNTAGVWAEHSVWPQDPQFPLALAGGVTTMHVLPGSANLFGGRGVTLKNVPAVTVQEMKYPGAPQSLKMACGENPKRIYGARLQAPSTRMGNVAGHRTAWRQAQRYRARLAAAADDPAKDAPEPDLAMETLVGVLNGDILVQNHCYRAEEMAVMIDVAREFGYRIAAFHHAVESYKIAPLLAAEGICSATWADNWGFKLEAFDAIQQNLALLQVNGACAIVHSDSAREIQRLNQEAAKGLAAGRRVGLEISDEQALAWITLNAARAIGIDDDTGSIEAGKAADLVLWSGHPFSVYSRPVKVFIDGYLYFDADDPMRQPVTDFEFDTTPRGRLSGADR